MTNKDLIKTLLEFDLDSSIIILTKEEDLLTVAGKRFPGIKFGNLQGDDKALVLVGDYNEQEDEEKGEAK